MDFAMTDHATVLLVDNGSLQPASTLSLRRLAAALSVRLGRTVFPVSLLHSSAIDAVRLDGEPAEIFEPAIRRRFAEGAREFVVVPLFFGPSGALTSYLPERIEAVASSLGRFSVRLAAPLVDPKAPDDRRLAAMLADHVRLAVARAALSRPSVIMVDHGSPQAAVGAVRDRVARQLGVELGDIVVSVVPASMERREGVAYDFNEPLLARALADAAGDVVVALLFFSPGRHAGPGGDIETICRSAEAAQPGLRVHLTALVGEHPGLVDLLEERARALLG